MIISKADETMNTFRESAVIGTAMEDRWKGLSASSGRRPSEHKPNDERLVFYKDMRFWLILLMMVAFFVFTLIRFP